MRSILGNEVNNAMKKWVIFSLIVLGCLLLALQYFAGKREKVVVLPLKAAPNEQTDVPLPPSSANYVGGNSNDGGLILPVVQSNYKGACPGGSLEEMRLTHGRYWGYLTKGVAVNRTETQKMYDLLANYVGCVAVAQDNLDICDTLPGEMSAGVVTVEASISPKYKCRERGTNALFGAYMAGKVKDAASCQGVVSYWGKNAAGLSVPDFCTAAAGGMERADSFLAEHMPSMAPGQFMKASLSCSGSGCLPSFKMYNAVKKGSSDACPRPSDGYCEALITKTPASCDKIVQEMSEEYCSSVARVNKITGGYIGMTQAEMETDIAQQKLKKEEAERQKKENEKIQAAVDKQAKILLNKK